MNNREKTSVPYEGSLISVTVRKGKNYNSNCIYSYRNYLITLKITEITSLAIAVYITLRKYSDRQW